MNSKSFIKFLLYKKLQEIKKFRKMLAVFTREDDLWKSQGLNKLYVEADKLTIRLEQAVKI